MNKVEKPELRISRMLVGHDYMANEPAFYNARIPAEHLAPSLARKVAFENGNKISMTASYRVFEVEQGYVVTFAWVEWVEVEMPQVSTQGV